MTNMTITAVLFDWDFTLARTLGDDVSFSQRTAILFQQNGIACTQTDIEAALEQLHEDIRQGKAPGVIHPQKRREIITNYRQLLIRLGHENTSRAFAYHLYSAYARLPHFLYPDVRPTLAALQPMGVRLGILSNHSKSVRQTIEAHVGEFIPAAHITISEEVGVHKPGKTIFRRAAARIRTPAAECAYVGDNLQVDAIGAVQQGNYALGLWLDRSGRGAEVDLPDNVNRITSLEQVSQIIHNPG